MAQPNSKLFDRSAIAAEQAQMKFFCEIEYCRKSCSKFIPDVNHRRRGRCQGCLYLRSQHLTIPNLRRYTNEATTWRSEIHLEYVAWKSFMKLTLTDEVNSVEKEADVAIIANDTHPKQLIHIITQRWMLEKPSFVIAVSGSQRYLPLTSKQVGRFKRELVQAVASSKSWIIGGGTLSGVDGLVGQALRELQFRRWIVPDENEFYLLGLVNWDCVDIRTRLDKRLKRDENARLNFMIKHGAVDSQITDDQFMTTLNPLYSHFLCVEGGIKGRQFQELECRNDLLSYIAKPFDDFTVPSVLLIVGGELETLKEVSTALSDDIPVVICEGTGGASDVICYALRVAERQENNKFTAEQEQYIVQQIEANLVDPKPKGALYSEDQFEAAKEMKHLHNCIDKRRNIFIYRINLSLSMPLNQCILKALLNGKTAQTKDPVELALEWNRCDDVIKDILNSEGGDMGEKRDINKLMTKAILEDKIEFIELFIEYGFEWQKFLTPNKLASLYAHAVLDKESAIRELLEMHAKNKDSFKLKDVYQIVYRYSSAKPESFYATVGEGDSARSVFQDPFRELFIWAILTERMEASLFFWKYCHNGLHLALIGSALWKAIALITHSVNETKIEELLDNSKVYLDYAQEVLECAWNVNKSLAHVTLELKPWALGRKSVLDIAGFIEAKEFIGHPLSQIVLEHQWKGRLNCTLGHVFLGLLFPPYLNFISVTKKLIPAAPEELWLHDVVPVKPDKDPDDDDDDEKAAPKEPSNVEKKKAMLTKEESKTKIAESNDKKNGNGVEQSSDDGEGFEEDEGEQLLDKLALFYGVPVTKFIVHMISYMAFLIIYSMFYIFYFSETGERSFYEWIVVWIWIASYLDLVQSLVAQDATWLMKIKLWVQSEWNVLDFCYLNIALIAFMFHGSYPGVVKGWYGIVCLLMWVRLLRFYNCSPLLGPMWIMIRKMLVELVIFLSILGILILASGIFLKVMMNSFSYEDNYSGPLNSMDDYKWLFLRPFFMFLGELFMDAVQGSVTDLGLPVEERDMFLLIYFFAILFIMFFGNALLLNLVIAIFGTIYSEVQGISDMEWKNEMFLLVREYQNKPHFPPPFSIIESVISLVKYLRSSNTKLSPEEIEAEKKSSERFSIFETFCVDRTLKERETRLSPLQELENTIMCVDNQHSRLFDMELTIQDMARIAQKKLHP